MIIDTLQTITNVVDSLRSILAAYKQHEQDQAFYESEYLDLTHALELTELEGGAGEVIALQLQENRRKRRVAKDQLHQLQEVHEYLTKNPAFLNYMERVPCKITKIRTSQGNRQYSPRTNSVLRQAFDKAQERAIENQQEGVG